MINETFRKYLEEAIGSEKALVAFSAVDTPAPVSVRLNPSKRCHAFEGRKVKWNELGYMLDQRPSFTLDPALHGGAYYVQDSSSMFVGYTFRALLETMELPMGRPVRVLDLCAAPGGKSTDLAASLRQAFGENFLLVSNEVMKQRAGILADNMALWGDPNVVVTSDDPKAFSALPEFFDIVVADVPCSGEGMFRKDEEAQRQWSEDNVALCEARQRRIIADMWPCIARNGLLVYSTCTFNRYENDGNVSWIMENLGGEPASPDFADDQIPGVIRTGYGYSMVPGHVEGEGQYCAALRKVSETDFTCLSGRTGRKSDGAKKTAVSIPSHLVKLFTGDVTFRQKGDMITAVPKNISTDVQLLDSYLHVLAAGCAVGIIKGKDLVPDADLALSLMLNQDSYPSAEVDLHTALAFLHRDAIVLPDAPRGYVIIRYEGLALGFVKNLGNRCNNLHPQGRRIRMDINNVDSK